MDNTTDAYERHFELTGDTNSAAILTLAEAVAAVATQIKYLGNGDAMTPMGGMEALGVVLKEEMSGISSSITALAEAVDNS